MADPKIKIRRSSTPNKVPSTTQLQLGELAINTYDGKLYLEQDQGGVGVGTTVIAVNPWSVGIGSTAYNTHFLAGKAGIGTTNAQYNLDVGGDINFTGNLYQDGSAFTSGVGIRTAGGTVGWAATIIDFRGPGVTTAYYSSSTGIGTVYFQGGGGGGGGNASVTVSDSAPSSPSNGDLWFKSDVGELYLWYTDGSSNQWVEASGGSNTVITSDTAPSSPQDGDLWWSSLNGELKVYYNDGNSSQWVDATSGGFLQYWTQTNTNGNLGVTTTGFVGIGTTTATDALTVVGAADIDGNLIVSGITTIGGQTDLNGHVNLGANSGHPITVNGKIDSTLVPWSDDSYDLGTSGTQWRHLYVDGTADLDSVTVSGVSTFNDTVDINSNLDVSGNVTVGGVLTYEDVKNVDAIGIVTARKGLKVLAGGANIVDGTTTDELNVTGVSTFAGITTSTGTIFGKQLSISGISTLKNTVVGGATTELIVHGDARVTGVLSVGQGSLSINERDIYAVGVVTGSNFKTGTTNVHSAGVELAGVNVLGADTPIGTGATVYNSGLIVGKQGAEFQGVVTASSFVGDGSNLTGVISGVGIGTAGGVVGYAATILHFKGAGVTTAYYSATTGVGTVFFHSATTGGGGGNANVTISDTPPGSPSAGDLWWESDVGELKIYYNDGNSSQWIDASGADSLVQIGTSAPTGSVSGDLWWNSQSGDLMVYYTDANTSQWVSVNAVNSQGYWNSNSTGIHTAGNVGIGTTTATDALTVVGAADIDGNLIVSGVSTFTGNINLNDNDKIGLGDGSDLNLYHSGSHSFVKHDGTGMLKICANMIDFRNAADNATLAYAQEGNKFELFYGGNAKLATTNTGVNVTGDIVGSGSTAYSTGLIVGKQGAEFQGVVTASNFSGNITLPSNDITTRNLKVTGLSTFVGNAQFDANVNILGTLTYEDVKNVDSVGIATARQGLRITGGGLDVVGVSTFAGLIDSNGGINVSGSLVATSGIIVDDSIIHDGDTNTKIRFPANDTITAETNGNERLRITSNGRVGILTISPERTLDVRGNFQIASNTGIGSTSFLVTNTSFQYNQIPGNSWGNCTHSPQPLIAWDWVSGPGDLLYLASGGNTATADQMAVVISDGHGVKIGKSGFNYTSHDTGTGANEFVRIKTDGTIGIGTASPIGQFHLHKASTSVTQVIECSSGAASLQIRHTNGYGTANFWYRGTEKYRVGQTNTSTDFNIYDVPNSAERFNIASNAVITATQPNSAIGLIVKNTAHDSQLQILATAANKNSVIWFGDNDDGNKGWIDYDHNNDNMSFRVNGSTRAWFDNANTLYLQGTSHTNLEVRSNSASTKGIIQTVQDSDVRMGATTNHPLALYAGQNERLRLDTSGRLLAGTTSNTDSNERLNITHPSDYANNVITFSTQPANTIGNATVLNFRDKVGISGQIIARNSAYGSGLDNALQFLTSTSSNNAPTVRMTLTEQGKVLVNTTTNPYDSRSLTVGLVPGQSNNYISICAATNGVSGLTFGDAEGQAAGNYAGMFEYYHTGDYLTYKQNGNERLRITSGGSVRIGGSTPVGYSAHSAVDDIVVGGTSSHGITVLTGNSATGNLWFDSENGNRGYIQYAHNEEALILGTENNERLRITSDGRLWLGINSWSGHASCDDLIIGDGSGHRGLTVYSGSSHDGGLYFADGMSGNTPYRGIIAYEHANDAMAFRTSATERLRITSSGEFLIGYSSALSHSGIGGYLNLTGTGSDSSSITQSRFSNDAWCPFITMAKSRSGTKGTHTVVQANDYLGFINFAGSDGTDFDNQAATIAARVDGTPGSNDMPGRLEFSTAADGSNSPSERFRINSSGLYIGGKTSYPLCRTHSSRGMEIDYNRWRSPEDHSSGISSWVLLGNDYGPNPYPVRTFKIAVPESGVEGSRVYQVWHDGDANYDYGGMWEIRINQWTSNARFESVAIRCVNGKRNDMCVRVFNNSNGIMIRPGTIWGRVYIRLAGYDSGQGYRGSSYCAVANNAALAIYNSQGTDDGTVPTSGSPVDLFAFDGHGGSHTGGRDIENSNWFAG